MKYLNLREEELSLLEALVKSPAFGLLKKVCEQQKEIIKNNLVSAQSFDQVRMLQGQIAGVNQITSIPEILAKLRETQRAQKAEKEKARPKNIKKTPT